MSSKTISLERSAYERLAAAKRPGESFSDVVNRLTQKDQPSLMEFTEVLSPEAAEDLKATFLRLREEEAALQKDRAKRLWGEG
ncbi:MAG: antitoxin VapB family protein [Euryarchaeota archaeon]|nr:antitoxin VapB family protein [Euryarchaeota archaeon]